MKKINDSFKPYLPIVFGALLLLFCINGLNTTDGQLAVAIIGTVFAAYYLFIGIAPIFLKKGLPEILDVPTLALFPLYFFVKALVRVITLNSFMGPTAWIIAIWTMVASLAFPVCFFLIRIGKVQGLGRLTKMLSAAFALSLILDLLFDTNGSPIVLGNFSPMLLALYLLYVATALPALTRAPEPKEEPKPEEKEETEEKPEE